MRFKLTQRHVFRHRAGLLDLCAGTIVSAESGPYRMTVSYAGLQCDPVKHADFLEYAEKIDPDQGAPEKMPHRRVLTQSRSFRVGFSVITCVAGTHIYITQFDLNNKKVIVNFGNGLSDWFSEADIYSSSDVLSV